MVSELVLLRVGEAFLQRAQKIRTRVSRKVLGHLNALFQAGWEAARCAESEKIIDHNKRVVTALALQRSPIGRLIKALNTLALCIDSEPRARRTLRVATKREPDPRMTLDQADPINVKDVGRHLTEEVEHVLKVLEEAQRNESTDALFEITLMLSSHAINASLRELRRLRILGVCKHCGQVMFQSTVRKNFCAESPEGRDCRHRAANKKWYAKSDASKGRMTRSAAASKAATTLWANRVNR